MFEIKIKALSLIRTKKLKDMIYDFYYSEKHDTHMRTLRGVGREILGFTPPCNNYINGIRYTECITHGKKPITSHFDDLRFICTADDSNVNNQSPSI